MRTRANEYRRTFEINERETNPAQETNEEVYRLASSDKKSVKEGSLRELKTIVGCRKSDGTGGDVDPYSTGAVPPHEELGSAFGTFWMAPTNLLLHGSSTACEYSSFHSLS